MMHHLLSSWRGTYTVVVPMLLLVLIFISLMAFGESIPLTKDNFEDLTAGKTVFIKWYAPWCGHCNALAPVWDQLSQTLKDDDDQGLLIGEVDCTSTTENEQWCVEMGITGFPTLTYGETSWGGIFMKEYSNIINDDDDDEHGNNNNKNKRTYQDLYKFADETLSRPFCSPGNIQACSIEEQEKMYQYWNMTKEDLDIAIQNNEGKIEEFEHIFRSKFDAMQLKYDQMSQQHEINTAKLKRQIKFIQNIIAFQASETKL